MAFNPSADPRRERARERRRRRYLEDEYQWRQLVKRLEQHPPDELLRKARSHKAINGGPDWLNLYRALVEVYNHRRQEHSKLETRTKNWGSAPRERRAS